MNQFNTESDHQYDEGGRCVGGHVGASILGLGDCAIVSATTNENWAQANMSDTAGPRSGTADWDS